MLYIILSTFLSSVCATVPHLTKVTKQLCIELDRLSFGTVINISFQVHVRRLATQKEATS